MDPDIFLSLGHLARCKARVQNVQGLCGVLEPEGRSVCCRPTCLLRLQRVTFLAVEITDSTCSTGSHINKGLTEIQDALGVE